MKLVMSNSTLQPYFDITQLIQWSNGHRHEHSSPRFNICDKPCATCTICLYVWLSCLAGRFALSRTKAPNRLIIIRLLICVSKITFSGIRNTIERYTVACNASMGATGTFCQNGDTMSCILFARWYNHARANEEWIFIYLVFTFGL
jgi:hypothetical protein